MPTLYLAANICRSGIGSLRSERKGSWAKEWQNSDQIDHVVSLEPDRPVEIPKAAASLIELSSLKRGHKPPVWLNGRPHVKVLYSWFAKSCHLYFQKLCTNDVMHP